MKKKTAKETVQKRILRIFRRVYGGDESDAAILRIDPNDYDKDPAEFYEAIEDAFPHPSVLDIPSEMSSEGIGGTVAQTIKTIVTALNESSEVRQKRKETEAKRSDKLKAFIRRIAPFKTLRKKQIEKCMAELKAEGPSEIDALKKQAKAATVRKDYEKFMCREDGVTLDHTRQIIALIWFIAEKPDTGGHLKEWWPK